MNRRSSGLSLSKAIDGFLKYKVVEGLSDRTLSGYEAKLRLFLDHVGDSTLDELHTLDVEEFLYWLRTDYVAAHPNYTTRELSPKTIYNYWVALRSFFTWANRREFIASDPMADVPRPKFEIRPMDALTQEEVQKLLASCRYTREADTVGRDSYRYERATYRRDKAAILMLLDTGLRASELCALTVGDVNMKTGEVTVHHGKRGGAKGGRGRTVYIGKATRRTLWRYLVEREDGEANNAPLFLTQRDRAMNKDALRQILVRLGKKADLEKCHPHMFRHTFAINYLRSGGDVLTLQALLGHSNLDMVRRYARVAKIDLQQQHGKASPVDSWGL